MFGYVQIYKPELRVWELEAYNGIYCALCKHMGRHFGLMSRLSLSYDLTFVALMGMSVREKSAFKPQRCLFNPFKKKLCCTDNDDIFEYTSAVAVLMLHQKILDNLKDNKLSSKLMSAVSYPFTANAARKAGKLFPEIADAISDMTNRQQEAEQNFSNDIDRVCEPSADILGQVLSHLADDEKVARIMYRIGYCVGKWVYLTDAVDDFEKDSKSGDYNIIIARSGDVNCGVDLIEQISNNCIEEAISAANLLDIKQFEGIVNNILMMGLPDRQRSIYNKARGKGVS